MVLQILKICVTLLMLALCVSCQVQNSDGQKQEAKIPRTTIERDPINWISMGLQHSFGLAIKEENGVVVVEKLKEKGPAGVAGMKDGMKVKSILGFDLLNLDKQPDSYQIVPNIEYGSAPIVVINDDGTETEYDLKVTTSNCPQQRNSDFIFISDTDNENPPSVLVIQSATRIKKGSFNQEAANMIQYYDSFTDEWWGLKDNKDDFNAGVPIEKLANLATPGLFIDSKPENNIGMIAFSGEKRFELKYEISNEFELNGKRQIGEGYFKSRNMLFKGKVMVQHEEQFYILPHFKEKSDPLKKKPLTADKAQVTVKVLDWIMLFDKSGSLLELSVDGAYKKWLGVYMPSNAGDNNDLKGLSDYLITDISDYTVEYVSLDDFNMTWFYEVVMGFEADPYPDDINIVFPNDFSGEIKLKSFTPNYLNDNHRIYIPLSGQFVPDDGSPIDVYGFMMRMQ
jgi:hypothetical protein